MSHATPFVMPSKAGALSPPMRAKTTRHSEIERPVILKSTAPHAPFTQKPHASKHSKTARLDDVLSFLNDFIISGNEARCRIAKKLYRMFRLVFFLQLFTKLFDGLGQQSTLTLALCFLSECLSLLFLQFLHYRVLPIQKQ
jgi:hypothetical protein